ncbi:DNA repair protein RecN [Flavobacterium sp. CYK-55]|uniref:DNA repair protein RecN n=1 Tax=Flavobacterium sp. CYK-55 TaxID=2835529 RepID=UPI001BCC2204|nr:DNA repair protein RecN [Flavobacterium sp. CYK-55]MBS7786730.1 DNA repair protein RecN [Flavobacterium sp. CYK-55]
MIQSLSIKNFALIEHLKMDFTSGFSIITGETGAGKSILLGALELVLGKRADLSSLKTKEEKCIIEAHFDISGYDLRSFFSENNLDYEHISILRREILPTGKSRAFINDTPVNLQELQNLGEKLLDIHAQHETRELSENHYQFKMLDAFSANEANLVLYQEQLKIYKNQVDSLQQFESNLRQLQQEFDYHQFLLNELQQLQLTDINQIELESQLEQLTHIEFIKENLHKAYSASQNEQFGVLQLLNEIKVSIQKISGFSTRYESLYERIESINIELKDITAEIEQSVDALVLDPKKAEAIEQKLQILYALEKKHQVSTVEDLIKIQQNLEQKVLVVDQANEQIQAMQTAINLTQSNLDEIAQRISKNRQKASLELTIQLQEILSNLGMPNARFKIVIEPTTQYFNNGKDELQFLFSANLGSDFGLLRKVASGGELSRIMLSAKATLAKYTQLPTIIFDEIDTGVSGEIANQMGEIMKQMSQKMQVFAITHLPQIAAKGNRHFKVFKTINSLNTTTEIKVLDDEQRIVEIAQMLSGAEVSESALNHAKSLLN